MAQTSISTTAPAMPTASAMPTQQVALSQGDQLALLTKQTSSAPTAAKSTLPPEVKITYQITFYCLIAAFAITFASSFFVGSTSMRTVLWLEALVCAVSAIIYSQFVFVVDVQNASAVTNLRYIDWIITTPLIIVALVMFLVMHSNKDMNYSKMVCLVLLGVCMLAFRYMGELNMMKRLTADLFGYVPFLGIFWILYSSFMGCTENKANVLLLTVYFLLWAAYGIIYMLDKNIVNTSYNVLDCVTKAFVAIGLSGYFLNY